MEVGLQKVLEQDKTPGHRAGKSVLHTLPWLVDPHHRPSTEPRKTMWAPRAPKGQASGPVGGEQRTGCL